MRLELAVLEDVLAKMTDNKIPLATADEVFLQSKVSVVYEKRLL
ncbi:hypothetical protein AB9T88_08705 [Flavobacterium sp. LBUM151]|jgi:hypothetical protein